MRKKGFEKYEDTYIQEILLQKDVGMCDYDDCKANFDQPREVFGIRSSIPRNSNAELKKQMVIMTTSLHSDLKKEKKKGVFFFITLVDFCIVWSKPER